MNMLIKRTILPRLLDHLKEPEITLIVGPRQAGKTTLMKEMEDYARGQGYRTLLLTLDREVDAEFFATQQTLIDRVKLEFGSEKGIVFLDEIQRKADAGRFLKGIYDMGLPYKMVVSGSGSLELKEQVHESLAGRKQVFEVLPLSFEEFADWKTGYAYSGKMGQLFTLEATTAKSILDEYLIFGGYPRAVLADTAEKKRAVLDEIYESYLLKDLRHLLNIQKLDDVRSLLRTLAGQNGQLLNISSLAQDIGTSPQTITNYLWYLEETYLIRRVTPYSRLARHEIRKSPVAYFVDLGMRNNILARAAVPFPAPDHNWLFQNMIGNTLHAVASHAATEVHFWRTKQDAEVDFIFVRGQDIVPIEVKDSLLARPTITRSYRAFLARYNPKRGYVVNHQFRGSLTVGKTEVIFLPWWSLGLVNK